MGFIKSDSFGVQNTKDGYSEFIVLRFANEPPECRLLQLGVFDTNPQRVITITIRSGPYTMFVLDVEDPEETVAQIEGAVV